MHSYLRAIGFNMKKKKEIEEIVKEVIKAPASIKTARINEDVEITQISKNFSERVGLTLVGEYNESNEFIMDYYYPYFNGSGVTTSEDVVVEKHSDKESYAGVCDEMKVGVSLIFYLQDVAEYMNGRREGSMSKQNTAVTLSGLSLSGKIILPISKNEEQKINYKEASVNRSHLIAAARQGDEEAIESLTLEDIDTYTQISRRIMHEDVFTLVDTYFMPYGIECEQYSVMGEILDYSLVKNSMTGAELYMLSIECNEMIFDVCINKEDILGEPAVGRRFKGVIWMQGKIDFM